MGQVGCRLDTALRLCLMWLYRSSEEPCVGFRAARRYVRELMDRFDVSLQQGDPYVALMSWSDVPVLTIFRLVCVTAGAMAFIDVLICDYSSCKPYMTDTLIRLLSRDPNMCV